MFTIRRVGGVALLLAGSSWLWLTPAVASPGVSTSGVFWAITNVLCLLTTVLVATGPPVGGEGFRNARFVAGACGPSPPCPFRAHQRVDLEGQRHQKGVPGATGLCSGTPACRAR